MRCAQTPTEVFDQWQQLLEAYGEQWRHTAGTFKWIISGEGGGVWLLDCGENPAVLRLRMEDRERMADCEIALAVDDFVLLARGQLSPQEAFLDSRMKAAGNLDELLRLNLVLEKLLKSS